MSTHAEPRPAGRGAPSLLLEGKVVLVTGGSRGIGAAAGELFASEGARVVLAARNEDQLAEAAARIRSQYGEADWVVLDLAEPASVRAAVRTVVDRHGRLDGAFNNGAVPGPRGSFDETTDDDLDDVYTADFRGQWVAMAAEAQAMRSSIGRGAIVNTSSVGSLRANLAHTVYGAMKRAMNSVTESAAVAWAADGVRVNAVAPGPTRTVMIDDFAAAAPDQVQQLVERIPMGRLGEPREVAEAAAWLLSDRASFVTGIVLSVDGGASASP